MRDRRNPATAGHEGSSTGILYPLVRALIRAARKLVWPVKVTGLENVCAAGPVIIAPNHISFLDSVVLIGVLPRRIAYLAKAEYMDSWKTRRLFLAMGMIPIDRSGGKASFAVLDTAASVLEEGKLFGIFPEGTRSRDGNLHRGRTGIARLALRTGAPVIPVGIRGTDRIQPPGASIPRLFRGCEVSFGRPIPVGHYRHRSGDPGVYRGLTDEIMCAICELSGQIYLDRYAARPDRSAPAIRPPAQGSVASRLRSPATHGAAVIAGQLAFDSRDQPLARRRVAVIGPGSWGTALAGLVAHNADVVVWALEPEIVASINERHVNDLFHPGVQLPACVTAIHDVATAAAGGR